MKLLDLCVVDNFSLPKKSGNGIVWKCGLNVTACKYLLEKVVENVLICFYFCCMQKNKARVEGALTGNYKFILKISLAK